MPSLFTFFSHEFNVPLVLLPNTDYPQIVRLFQHIYYYRRMDYRVNRLRKVAERAWRWRTMGWNVAIRTTNVWQLRRIHWRHEHFQRQLQEVLETVSGFEYIALYERAYFV